MNQWFKHRYELACGVVGSLDIKHQQRGTGMQAVADAVELLKVGRNQATTHIGRCRPASCDRQGSNIQARQCRAWDQPVWQRTWQGPGRPSCCLPFQTSLVIRTDGSARLRRVQSPWHASPQARSPRLAHGVCCSSLALRHIQDFSGGHILALLPESWVARNVPGTRGAVALAICGLTAEPGNRSSWASPRQPWICRVGVLPSLFDTE